jgi:ABC-2 type transport system ATP-binding protein
MALSNSILQVRDLSVSFGNLKAVRNINFDVERGVIHGFIGPNGAGKTTTIRVISTLQIPDSGGVWVNGQNVLTQPEAIRMNLGYMPDHVGVYAGLSVLEYLDFFAMTRRIHGAKKTSVISDVVELTDLGDLLDREVESLSKGMRQRMCLAQTLLHEPDLLILDEPASGLDPRARIEFRELILELRRLGKTVFLSSHILSELSPICDSVSIIEKGEIVANGTIEEIQALMAKGLTSFEVTLLKDPGGELETLLNQLPGFSMVMMQGRKFRFEWTGNLEEVAKVWELLSTNGYVISGISKQEDNLENIFMSLTTGEVQ